MLFIFSTFLSLLTFKGEKTVKKENVEEREEFPFEASNLDRRMRKKPKRNENNDSYLFFQCFFVPHKKWECYAVIVFL